MAVDFDQVRHEPSRRLAIGAADGGQIVHGLPRQQHERHPARQCPHRRVIHRATHDDQPIHPRRLSSRASSPARGRPCVARISRLDPAETLAASAPSSTAE